MRHDLFMNPPPIGTMTSSTKDVIKTHRLQETQWHGENTRNGALKMSRLFVFQVSYDTSYRSDNRFFIVLPCPRRLMLIVSDCFNVCKLLLCGYIEENPGPSVNEMVEKLLEGQKNIKDELAEVKKRLEETEKSVSAFFERMSTIEKRVNEMSVKADSIDQLSACVLDIEKST